MEENKFVLSDVVVLNENEDSITILDQTQLPAKEVYETITEEEALIDAIKKLKVRGAPAIGVRPHLVFMYVFPVRHLLSHLRMY